MPTPTAGRNCLSHLMNSFFLTLYLGEITPHLFILPKSWILNLPAMPSSMNSNSPMYLFFCMERRTAEPSFEAGTTRQSFLFLTSLLKIVENRFANTLFDGIRMKSPAEKKILFVFFEAKLGCKFSKTLPTKHQIVFLDQSTILTTASAPS